MASPDRHERCENYSQENGIMRCLVKGKILRSPDDKCTSGKFKLKREVVDAPKPAKKAAEKGSKTVSKGISKKKSGKSGAKSKK